MKKYPPYLGRITCAGGDRQKMIHLGNLEDALVVEALVRPELIKVLESCLGCTRSHQTDGDPRTSIGRYGRFEELRASVGEVT